MNSPRHTHNISESAQDTTAGPKTGPLQRLMDIARTPVKWVASHKALSFGIALSLAYIFSERLGSYKHPALLQHISKVKNTQPKRHDSLQARGVDSLYVSPDRETNAWLQLYAGIISDSLYQKLVARYIRLEKELHPDKGFDMRAAFDSLRAEIFPDPALYQSFIHMQQRLYNPYLSFDLRWPSRLGPAVGNMTRPNNSIHFSDINEVGGFVEPVDSMKFEDGSTFVNEQGDTICSSYKELLAKGDTLRANNPMRQTYVLVYNPVTKRYYYRKNRHGLRLCLTKYMVEIAHPDQIHRDGSVKFSLDYVRDLVKNWGGWTTYGDTTEESIGRRSRKNLYDLDEHSTEREAHTEPFGTQKGAIMYGRAGVLTTEFVSWYESVYDKKNLKQLERLRRFYAGALGTMKDPQKAAYYAKKLGDTRATLEQLKQMSMDEAVRLTPSVTAIRADSIDAKLPDAQQLIEPDTVKKK